MVEDPGSIRETIEETRAEMAETIEALGEKADVKGRASDKMTETTEQVKAKAAEVGKRVEDSVPDEVRPAAQSALNHAKSLSAEAQRRPSVAIAVGVVVITIIVLRRRGRRSAT
ncbi:MAG: DUF3618 domain-containing protein [Actinomycetota bacterium]|nr:DUF3618 domain-containing protein [Actinomycetota bacterium]